jgi:hypothetical protein
MMTSRRWIADALLGAGAIVFAYWGAVVTRVVVIFGKLLFEEGAGGLGAVSAGFSEPIVFAIVGSLLANRLLAPAARRSGGLIKKLHRLHSLSWVATIACVGLLAILLAVRLEPARPFVAMFCLAAALLAVQFWLLAAFLGALIRHRATPLVA